MLAILHLLGTFVACLFKSRRQLEIENLFLRHQLNVALRRVPHHLRLRNSDRVLIVWMTRLWPSLLRLSGAAGDGGGDDVSGRRCGPNNRGIGAR
jgi:hypothetical protein